MKPTNITREEMWARQHLSIHDIDYAAWERDKAMLHQMAKVSQSCTFVVDVYKSKYVYASYNFADLLGYDSNKIATLERQGDYLESRFHPDDFDQLVVYKSNWDNSFIACPWNNEMIIAIFTVFGYVTPSNNM